MSQFAYRIAGNKFRARTDGQGKDVVMSDFEHDYKTSKMHVDVDGVANDNNGNHAITA